MMKLSLVPPALAVVLAAPALAGNSPQADLAVVNICIDLKRAPAICQCAASELAATRDPVEFGRYAAVAAGYLGNKYQGLLRRQAWQQAVAEQADHEDVDTDTLSNQMDDASGAHRKAMLNCSQQ